MEIFKIIIILCKKKFLKKLYSKITPLMITALSQTYWVCIDVNIKLVIN
jgi:hypothetical protein